MDLLKDWLAPTIQRELSQALQWKEGNSNEEQSSGTIARYSDDGSNLRIQSSTLGVVQISKFSELKEPIVAIVSDKYTRLKARISVAATRKYAEKERRPFTKDKTGGWIQILDFEIVATHIGPRSDRLMLFVNDFRSLGSDGSAIPNVPRPIESPDKGCFILIEELKRIRHEEKADDSRRPSTSEGSAAPSIQSQAAPAISNVGSPDSQSFLVTQVPFTRRNHLEHEQKVVAHSIDIHTSRQEGNAVVARVEIPSGNAAQNATRRLSKDFTDGPNQPSLHPASKNKIPAPSNVGTATVAMNGSMKGANGEALMNGHENANVQALQDNQESIRDHAIEDAVESSNQVPAQSNTSFLPSKRRKLNDRIRSRDVRIPKDQQAILDRQDSWLPAEPGQKDPRANLPIVLLQAFNGEADKHQRMSAPAHEEHAAVVPDDDSLGTHSSSFESDIASAEWPPSPDQNRLPPDSSPPDLEPAKSHTKHLGPTSPALQDLVTNDVLPKDVPASSIEEIANENIEVQNVPLSSDKYIENEKIETKDVPASSNGQIEVRNIETKDASDSIPSGCSTRHRMKLLSRKKLQKLENQVEHARKADNGANDPRVPFGSRVIEGAKYSLRSSDAEEASDSEEASFSEEAAMSEVASLSEVAWDEWESRVEEVIHGTQEPRPSSQMENLSGNKSENGEPVYEKPSPEILPSSHSLPGSDIEITVPTALQELNKPVVVHGHPESFPPTAPVSKKPFTQVKRTPYADGNGHRAPERPFADGWRATLAEGNASARSAFGEGTQIPCTTSTRISDPTASTCETSRSLAGLDQGLIQGDLAVKEHMLQPSSPGANVESTGERAPLSLNHSQATKRPLQSSEDHVDDAGSSKRVKTNLNNSHVDSSRLREKPTRPPMPEVSNETEDGSHGSGADQIPTGTVVKRFGIGQTRAEIHGPASRASKTVSPHAAHPSLPLQEEGPEKTGASPAKNLTEVESFSPTRETKNIIADRAQSRSSINMNGRQEHYPSDPGQQIAHSSPQELLDHVKLVYPEYTGNITHFLSLCKTIEVLRKQDRLPRSLWDDFLIRSKTEYPNYVQECLDIGETALAYERFYHEEIEEPKYCKKILTPSILEMILHGNGSRNRLSHASSVSSDLVKRTFTTIVPDAASHNTSGLQNRPTHTTNISFNPVDRKLNTSSVDLASHKGSGLQKRTLHTASISSTPDRRTLNAIFAGAARHETNGLRAGANSDNTIDLTQDDGVNGNTEQEEMSENPNAKSSRRRRFPYQINGDVSATLDDGSKHIAPREQRPSPPLEPTKRSSKHDRSLETQPGINASSTRAGKAKLRIARANANGDNTHENAPLWWQDENTPFKGFMKSYLAIRPGNGNTYAKPEDIAWGIREQRRNKIKIRGAEDLDFLNWQI